MKKYVEIQPYAVIPAPGTPVGLYEFGGSIYCVSSQGLGGAYVGASTMLPIVSAPTVAPAEQQAAGITPDHLIKLAAVLLQPGTVSDLYGKV